MEVDTNVRRLLMLVMLISVAVTACQSGSTAAPTAAPNTETKPAAAPAAAASPAAASKPAAAASPVPAAAPAATGFWATLRPIGQFLSSETTLVTIGIILSIAAVIAWKMSNRAEATPNEDQLAEMRHFVNDHFARYVARGLAVEGVGEVAVSQDRAWQKVYLQHLRLHNELYAFRRDVALKIFTEEIDGAVRREMEAVRAAGVRPNPAVVAS
jgi:hypothetical protein